jgi:dTDP-4-dehydrorhamnose reductase
MSNALIIGADGTIGGFLSEFLIAREISTWVTTRHPNKTSPQSVFLDLAQDYSTWQMPSSSIRTAIICAAITSQKVCEDNYEESYNINVRATVELARRLVNSGVFVVFLSTNLVFDGSNSFSKPDAAVRPQTVYGRQKAEAERLLSSLSDRSISIVRLSKVIDKRFQLFRNWIVSLKESQEINPFHDLYFSPISIEFVANLIFKLHQYHLGGIIQVSATEDISYADAATYLAQKLRVDTSLVKPISCQSLGTNINPPRFTTMNSERIKELGLASPSAWNTLDTMFDNMFAND